MRVLHLVTEFGSNDRGVPQKVRRTVDAWRRLGVEVEHLDLATGAISADGVAESGSERPRRLGRAGWILEMERRGRRLLDVLGCESPDIVYTRELVWSPAVERIFRRHRVVLEINSDRAGELASTSRAAAAFWRVTSARLRRRAAGIVSVTHELATTFSPAGVPSAVVANAADVPASPPPRCADPARPLALMLVGNDRPWHGLDRLCMLAEALPQFEFAICGNVSASMPADARIRVCSPRSGDALADLLSRATVCIGSLALHRAGLREACPLKSRAALAAGVPLVYAYDDPDLAGDEPFALRVTDRSDWSADDVARVEAFIRRAAADPELGLAAWRFAGERLDREVVERRRLDFMRSLLPGAVDRSHRR